MDWLEKYASNHMLKLANVKRLGFHSLSESQIEDYAIQPEPD
jgi:hypothetical protein